MNRKRLYWFLQVMGWGAWLLNDTIVYINARGFRIEWPLLWGLNMVLVIWLTHTYRSVIKQQGWVENPIQQVMPRILLAVLLMAVLMAAINLPVDHYFFKQDNPEEASNLFSLFLISQYILNWAKPLTIWTLFYYASHYFERKSEVEVEKIRLESSIKETEAKVLRAQMNPHFMFNALNSIRALILEDPDRAQKAITQLSGILRSSLLADRRKTVSLGEELKTVEDYLALEKIRYEERLQIRKNVYPDTLAVQVPPMLIQTLVENGIKHGVSKPVKGGFVAIESQVKGQTVEIRISNTGQLGATDSGGFGVENTTHRLYLIFGAQARFKLYQASKDVVCAEVLLPLPNPDEAPKSVLSKVSNIVRPRTRV
jgi:two-component system, LytTR family, sensor kinase